VLVSFGTASSTTIGVVHCRQYTTKRAKTHQSPSGCRCTIRILCWIMNRPAGLSSIATSRLWRIARYRSAGGCSLAVCCASHSNSCQSRCRRT
jgi:hypothetical protein